MGAVDFLKSILDIIGVVLGVAGLVGTVLSFIHKNSAILRKLRIPLIGLLLVGMVVGSFLVVRRLTPPPPAFPNAASDQTITVSLATNQLDVSTLDPALIPDSLSYEVSQLVFPNLLTLDSSLHLTPWAASSYSTSPDGKLYTFHLRPGMRWSDGTPIDAHSFAYAINRSLSPCTKAPNARYLFALRDAKTFNAQQCQNGIISAPPGQTLIPSLLNDPVGDSIVVADDLTLELNLPQAAPYFLYALTYPVASAAPPAAANSDWTSHLTDNGGFGGNLFVLTQHGQGTVTLQRNAHFWGAPPEAQKIVFDLATGGTNDDIGCVIVSKCTNVNFLAIDYIGVNWSKAPFDDLRMRQAFALAVDKTQLCSNGFCKPTNHIVPDGMPGYQNTSLVGPDKTSGLAGNVAQARSLAQAYAAEHCGGRLSACPAVTFTYPAATGKAYRVLSMWQAAFPDLQITGAPVSPDVFNTQSATQGMQLWFNGWQADYPDAQDFLSLQFLPDAFYSTQSTVGIEDVISLLKQADVELDAPTRAHDYDQAEQSLVTNVAWIPLDQSVTPVGYQSYVANYHITALGFAPLEVWQRVYILRHTASSTSAPNVLYQNSMTSRSTGWANDQNCFFGPDGYHIKDGGVCDAPAGHVTDADIGVQVKQVAGATNIPYGIALRLSDLGYWYEFDVDSNAEWAFFKCTPNQCATLVDYTSNGAINSGLNATNTLEVRAVASHFDFFVNGTKVGQGDDTTFSSGLVSLVGDDGIEVVFTNLTIKKLA